MPHIHVNDLQVGMFIHLDLGWMAHPFPLSSFKITTAQQIVTIRQLGVAQVRWSPERSETPMPARGAGAVQADVVTPAPVAESAPTSEPASAASTEPAPAVSSAAAQAVRRTALLEQQRQATRHCERQFSEACQELKRAMQVADADPVQTGHGARQLTQVMLDKMLAEEEPCVRVLVEGAGDRASLHALNVSVLSLLMGRMFQMPADDLLDLGVGALLHDIGKLDLPERARYVDETASSAEMTAYRDHVARGLERARRMNLSPAAQLVVAQHHERADGSGFPLGLTLERMSAAARIVAMVNHYDNLCNAPNPALSLTPHEALSRLFSHARNKFDMTMLNGFIRMMGIYPPGSVVQLTDDRYASVVSVNSTRPLKPVVLVCDPKVPRELALQVDLERQRDLGIRRSLKLQALPGFVVDYLRPRPRVTYFFDKAASAEAFEESLA